MPVLFGFSGVSGLAWKDLFLWEDLFFELWRIQRRDFLGDVRCERVVFGYPQLKIDSVARRGKVSGLVVLGLIGWDVCVEDRSLIYSLVCCADGSVWMSTSKCNCFVFCFCLGVCLILSCRILLCEPTPVRTLRVYSEIERRRIPVGTYAP